MDVAAFDYPLPEELIAKAPLPERDASRLLLLPRGPAPLEHRLIRELPALLGPRDLLVVNDARVIPARLHGKKRESGGKVELLLIEPLGDGGRDWLALAGSGKPVRAGAIIDVAGQPFEIVQIRGGGEVAVRAPFALDELHAFLEREGELPLPPYLDRAPEAADRERYQTVFATAPGAIAAPTAGLHFTEALLDALAARGVQRVAVTLHVGPGTFLPVRAAKTEDHKMHSERYEVPAATAAAVARCRADGGRVIAVGTTALRTLEAAWREGGLQAGPGSTDLFCTPGYRFRAVDGLLTNFHLPKSTLLMLVAAFAGLDKILDAYRQAVRERYRFFSYGDAMLIV